MNYRIKSYRTDLTDSDISDMRLMAMKNFPQTRIAEEKGVHRKTVFNVLNGITWNHVPNPVPTFGFSKYLVFPDGRVYSTVSDQFVTTSNRADGTPVVRIKNSKGKRVTVPVATLVARGYYGTRSSNPKITYLDGNPSNVHFTNISL